MDRTGASEEHAVLMEVLAERANPSDAIRELLKAERTGALRTSSRPEGQWLSELARRLFGPKGATTS
jgi:hypothetical protein